MLYTIISINDEREFRKQEIREAMSPWSEVKDIKFVNGCDEYEFAKAIMEHDVRIGPRAPYEPRAGELGEWYSFLNIWKWMADTQTDELAVIEDDARVLPGGTKLIEIHKSELPFGWDVLALSVPYNQLQDYNYQLAYDEYGRPLKHIPAGMPRYQYDIGNRFTCKSYQGYGTVGIMFSYVGACRLYNLAIEYGITGPIDCWIFEHAHAGRLNAYSPKPSSMRAVYDDAQLPTQVHDTPLVEFTDWKLWKS